MTFEETDEARRALLPAGLSDALPPEAAHRAAMVERLVGAFAAQGYDRVDPPLVEFEDSLLSTDLSSLTGQTFRLMDPVSQRMMGLRADITTQIARIATTRLGSVARPLRLAYAGDVLRVKGSQLRPERQFTQVGVELIGAAGVAADVEVVRLAADSLTAIGIADLSVDLTVAPLVSQLFQHFGVDRKTAAALRVALDRKDADAVAALAGPANTALGGLLAATGPARPALMILTSIDLPPAAKPHLERLAAVVEALGEALPEVRLTIDPVEHRGYEYHSGIGFALFTNRVRGELGRGGRYLAGVEGQAEAATGFSLFLDVVMQAVLPPSGVRRAYLPPGTPHAVGRALREQGWITIAGLDDVPNSTAEARRLGCVALWSKDKIEEVDSPK